MADNFITKEWDGANPVPTTAHEVPFSGDSNAKMPIVAFGHAIGSEGSKTFEPIVGNAAPAASAYGLTVRKASAGLPHHFVAAASTNAANVKSSAGKVKAIGGHNPADYACVLKLHNITGSPNVGTTAVVMAFGLPINGPFYYAFPEPIEFDTGIARSLTKGAADSDTTALDGSALPVVDIYYE